MKKLIGQRDLLESEINKIIFIDHSGIAFDLIKSSNICKFKYSDNTYLIDRLCIEFKKSVTNKDDYIFYYRKLIFDVLTTYYSNSKKFKTIIMDLEQFYKNKLDRNIRDSVECLINELKLYKRSINKECITERDKKTLQKSFNIREKFSKFVEKSQDLSYPFVGVSKLHSKSIITIDSKRAAYDGAISIKKTHYGYQLVIYITDVASYVGNDTILYEHAYQRGESIYTNVDNNSYIPMFPHEITRNFFSLNSGTYKKAVAHCFNFSNDFELIDVSIKPCKIRVSKNYTFEEIERIKSDDPNYDMIYLLSKLADKLESYFNLDYHTIKEQKNTIIRKNKTQETTGSHIITISTLFLNSYIADTMSRNKYPFIYRVNDTSLSDKLLNSSIYSVNDLGHVVNNGNCYGRVTSPIRSFASLLNQYFELMLLVDDRYKKNATIDKNEFIEKWSSELPRIVDDLNLRLFLNSEYKDAIEKIFGKQLTKKR